MAQGSQGRNGLSGGESLNLPLEDPGNATIRAAVRFTTAWPPTSTTARAERGLPPPSWRCASAPSPWAFRRSSCASPPPMSGPYASAFWRVALALPVLYAWMRFEESAGALRTAPEILHQADPPRRPRLRRATCSSGTSRSSTRPSPMPPSSPRPRRSSSSSSPGSSCAARGKGHPGRAWLFALRAARPHRAEPQGRSGAALGRRLRGRHRLLLRPLFHGRRASAAGHGRRRRVTFEAGIITAAILFVIAVALRHADAPARRRRASRRSLRWPVSAMRAARACSRSRSGGCRRPSRPS